MASSGFSNDAFAGCLWFLSNLLLASRMWRLATALFPEDERWRQAGCALLFCWTWICGLAMMLAQLSALQGTALLVCNTALLLIWHWCEKREWYLQHSQRHGTERQSLCNWLLAVIAAVLFAAVIPRSLLTFPTDWDTQMYHLPLVDEWLHSHSFAAPGCPVWYNPGNNEVLGLWLVAPFSGDFWVSFAGIVGTMLLAIATCAACQELKLRPTTTICVVLASIGTEVALQQVHTGENDIAVVALFAFALAYGFRWSRTAAFADGFVTTCSVALLAGVKYYALGYSAVCASLIMIAIASRQGLRRASMAACLLVFGSIMLSGHWYLRNFLETGSPLYPLGFGAETNDLAHIRPHTFSSTLIGNGDISLLPQCVDSIQLHGGYVQYLAVLAFPFLLGWMIAAGLVVRRNTVSRNRLNYWLLFAAMCGTIAVFSVTPFLVDPDNSGLIAATIRVPRFGQCPLWALTMASGLMFDDIFRLPTTGLATMSTCFWGLKSLPRLVMLGLSCFQFVSAFLVTTESFSQLSAFLLLDLSVFSVLCLHIMRQKRTRAWSRPTAIVISTILIAGASAFNSDRWHREFARFYDHVYHTDVFTWLQQKEPAPRLTATLHYRVYPFYGSYREFRVLRPKMISTHEDFLSVLETPTLDVLCVHPMDPHTYGSYRNTGRWAWDADDRLTIVMSGKTFDVYDVRNSDPKPVNSVE